MGYRSYYTLTVHSDKEAEIIEALRKESTEANYCMDADGSAIEGSTWWNDDEELKAFSLKYPNILFEVFREGEENGDTSYTYYKDGKMQQCGAIITYDEFDESKLK